MYPTYSIMCCLFPKQCETYYYEQTLELIFWNVLCYVKIAITICLIVCLPWNLLGLMHWLNVTFQKIRIYFKNNNIVDKKTSHSKNKGNTKDERESWLWNKTKTSSIDIDKKYINEYNGYIHNTDTAHLYFPTISNNQKIMKQFIKNDYNEFYNNVTSAESFINKISLEYTTQKINTAQVTFPSPFEQNNMDSMKNLTKKYNNEEQFCSNLYMKLMNNITDDENEISSLNLENSKNTINEDIKISFFILESLNSAIDEDNEVNTGDFVNCNDEEIEINHFNLENSIIIDKENGISNLNVKTPNNINVHAKECSDSNLENGAVNNEERECCNIDLENATCNKKKKKEKCENADFKNTADERYFIHINDLKNGPIVKCRIYPTCRAKAFLKLINKLT